MQPQGHVQVLLNILHGFNAQAALDAPRFCIDAEPIGYRRSATKVFLEEGIPVDVVDGLKSELSGVNGWLVHDDELWQGLDTMLYI